MPSQPPPGRQSRPQVAPSLSSAGSQAMLDSVVNAFRIPDLRAKLLFTFGMLVIFRFMAHVPVPGVNYEALRDLFNNNQLLGLLNLFSGGAMSSFSIVAMGVYP